MLSGYGLCTFGFCRPIKGLVKFQQSYFDKTPDTFHTANVREMTQQNFRKIRTCLKLKSSEVKLI